MIKPDRLELLIAAVAGAVIGFVAGFLDDSRGVWSIYLGNRVRTHCQRIGLLSSGFSLAHSLSALTPAYDSACHDRRSCPTHESYYYLTDDWDDVEAAQGWDHALEDLHTDNSAYNARNRVLEGI
jgi:hypothetical protein